MMAEVSDAEAEDVRQKSLQELHSQFFEMVPIRKMKWKVQIVILFPYTSLVLLQMLRNQLVCNASCLSCKATYDRCLNLDLHID